MKLKIKNTDRRNFFEELRLFCDPCETSGRGRWQALFCVQMAQLRGGSLVANRGAQRFCQVAEKCRTHRFCEERRDDANEKPLIEIQNSRFLAIKSSGLRRCARNDDVKNRFAAARPYLTVFACC